MTSSKQFKDRVRARMAKTGERYTTARRQLAGRGNGGAPAGGGQLPAYAEDCGYLLRGGVHPETATLANLLAHHGVTTASGQPMSEALLLGIGGGLGAGYILWEFRAHNARILTLGYRNAWQYPTRWTDTTLSRLGVPAQRNETGGAKGAAQRLTAELAAGRPALVWPDRQLVGYWHLPAHLEAHGGHPVVAYAQTDGRVHLDDRNLAPLSVERATLDAARARVVSYKNGLLVLQPRHGTVDDATLAAGARDGLRAAVEHLSAPSDSFSLPAWRKWARLMTDTRNPKAWPKVFADRTGLVGALLSTWEGIEPVGMTGGNLRELYAEFLDEAADLLDRPGLATVAGDFRAAAQRWHGLAETALCTDVPVFARMRELTGAIQESVVAAGDEGRADAAVAADELWALRAEYDAPGPLRSLLDDAALDALFAAMAEKLREVYDAESAAVRRLAEVGGGE